jgi:hypothetical protein
MFPSFNFVVNKSFCSALNSTWKINILSIRS